MDERIRSRALLVACSIIALALIVSVLIFSRMMVRTHSRDEVIEVTGSAQQPIRSDFIIWDAGITEQAADMPTAYRALQTHGNTLVAYLTAKGLANSEIIASSVTTKTLYVTTKNDAADDGGSDDTSGTFRKIAGYQLTEKYEVRSSKVDLVDELSRKSSELISSGVPLESDAPQYLYTQLGTLKVHMLAAAAKDARSRAEQIADNSGAHLGDVRAEHMGVLQIEPLYATDNSNDISDTGTNDTSSLDKKIIAVVNAQYSVQ